MFFIEANFLSHFEKDGEDILFILNLFSVVNNNIINIFQEEISYHF